MKQIYIFIITLLFYLFISFNYISSAECPKPTMPTDEEWQNWIAEVKILAIKEGISKKTVEKELNKVKPAKKILLRDRCQIESKITFNEYLYYRLDKARIVAGKKLYKKYKNDLDLIGAHFNIQPKFIISILGLESYYGKNQGSVKTMQAVTTLAYDRRRSSFYKKQLFAALKIIDSGFVSDKLVGSWGGAVGMPQFIPTTYLDSSYDWDKDGFADIWNNYLDVFASVANYLTTIDKNPWSKNLGWGIEVIPPPHIKDTFDLLKQKDPKGCGAVKSMSVVKPFNEWRKLGFKIKDAKDFPKINNVKVRLVSPDGIEGRMFLVYSNYKNILYYNCSSYYAIAIGLLSDAIEN